MEHEANCLVIPFIDRTQEEGLGHGEGNGRDMGKWKRNT